MPLPSTHFLLSYLSFSALTISFLGAQTPTLYFLNFSSLLPRDLQVPEDRAAEGGL